MELFLWDAENIWRLLIAHVHCLVVGDSEAISCTTIGISYKVKSVFFTSLKQGKESNGHSEQRQIHIRFGVKAIVLCHNMTHMIAISLFVVGYLALH